ncbi:MAG: two-component sensor histidine kinase [Deltaproteobacteria bacterium RIFOXYD12_FULL_57_12]|nr:MAG: two-component sensor histidine kinase [Deltaproteobacteria bacterium RIFOXYD12_FULL_57_12]
MPTDPVFPSAEAEEDKVSLKPFRLVKFFSFGALAMILASTLILSWMISNKAKLVMLDRSESYALLLAKNLNNQVFQQFVIPAVLRYGEIALSNPQQFKRLDTVVRNTTHGFKVDSVTIYDSKENIISYSTVAELVGKKDMGGTEYEKARHGENASRLSATGSLLNLLPGSPAISCKLNTYIPFTRESAADKGPEVIMGVTEIVQDLSDDLRAIIRLQATIITTSIAIMGGLFALLRLLVTRADQIIEARAEERRRLETKLLDAERLASLGKMVAAVSHEIKNPLGIIRSTAEILEKRLKSVAPGNEHLANIIVEETSRLDGVVMEFLDFARPLTPSLSAGSVNDVLGKLIEFIKPGLTKQGIELAADLEAGLPAMEVDGNLLYRAFLNILVNAMQAMPEGGTLVVSATRDADRGNGILVSIKDTGIGMPEEKREKIFQPFFTDKTRGTGLGLAIAKNIIDSHRGTITVTSEEGRGTAFLLHFPASRK